MEQSPSAFMDIPAVYRIRVRGVVNQQWVSTYCAMTAETVTEVDGVVDTDLVGMVIDQAALVGTLNFLYDRGYAVIAVERLEHDGSAAPVGTEFPQ